MRVGLKCKIISEWDRVAYQIKGKEVKTYIEANALTLHTPLTSGSGRSKKEGKDQESIQLSATTDPGYQ